MAILKDLIVNGASRFIGDAYFNTIKAGVWNGTVIDVAHGGTGKNSVTSGYLLVGNGNGVMNERLIVNDIGTSTSATTIPTSGAVYSAISAGFAANGAMVFKGTYTAQSSSSSSVVTSGFTTAPGSASLGWTWIVTGNNSYFGNIVVEAGDMIISKVSNPGTTISNYYVIQTNIDVTHYVTTNTAQTITGAKTFNAETTFNELSTFNKGLISTSIGDSDTDVLFVSGNSSFNDIVNIYGLTNHGNHVIPMNNNAYDLGSSSLKWRNIYAGSVNATTFTGSLSGNASTATTATNLSSKPSFTTYASDTTKITLTAGGKTSDAYTVPYATYSNTVKGAYTIGGGLLNPNYFGTNRVGFLMMNTTVNGNSNYKDWMIMDCYNNNDVGGGVAFGVNRLHLGAYIMRSESARTSWTESAELYGTHNLTKSVVTGLIGSLTYAPYNANGYLPLSGGILTGNLYLKGSANLVTNSMGSYANGIRINRSATSNWAGMTIGYVSSDQNGGGTGSDSHTWMIATPGSSDYLNISQNGNISTSTGLTLQGHGNNLLKWNNNTIYHAGNLPAYPTKDSWNYDDRYVSSLTTSGNYLRWVKNGSNNDITIPYATNADTVDGYHASAFVKSGDYVFNSEWAPRYLNTLLDNDFYALDKRCTVTMTNLSNVSILFDGSFESAVTISGTSSVITIKNKNGTTNTWTQGLPYGNIYIIFYNSNASNITARVYCNYSGHGIGWHDLTVKKESNYVWSIDNSYYQIGALEITITNNTGGNINISQITHHATRPSGPSIMAAMSKYCDLVTDYNITAARFIGLIDKKLTITLNGGSTEGTNKFTFNNSADKTINITPASIGAATTGSLDNYLPLDGGIMTGAIKRSYTSASDDPVLNIASKDRDIWLWRVSDTSYNTSSAAGFGLKYLGTGSGELNNLALFADNFKGNSYGDQIQAITISQAGHIGIGTTPTTSTGNLVKVNGNVEATKFIKTGGTSSQFLKADGSIDSNTYVTTSTNLSFETLASDATNNLTVKVNGTTKYIGDLHSRILDITLITSEADITNSGLRVYSGSGSNWTGTISSMAYAAILHIGNPSRGFEIWAVRDNDAKGLYWRRGNSNQTDWSDIRFIADSVNSSLSTSSTNVVSLKLLNSTASVYNTSYIDNLSLYANKSTTTSSIALVPTEWKQLCQLSATTLLSNNYGTYVVQITKGTGSSFVFIGSGIMSYGSTNSSALEEIVLHCYGGDDNRLYLGTQNGYLMGAAKVSLSAAQYTITFKRII